MPSYAYKSDKPLIIWYLPRGFIVYDELEFPNETSHFTMHYYDYQNNAYGGTHFHISYGYRWSTTAGKESQCYKLGIPEGDFFPHGFAAIGFAVKVGEAIVKDEDLETVVNSEIIYRDVISFHNGTDRILFPTIPKELYVDSQTGFLRDSIYKINGQLLESNEDEGVLFQADFIRQKLYVYLNDIGIDSSFPIYRFADEVIASFNYNLRNTELRVWCTRLRNILSKILDYIRSEIEADISHD